MKCDEIKDIILGYMEKDLDKSRKLLVENHIGGCKECDLLYRESSQMWNLLGNWETVEPKADFVAKFWDKVSEEDAKKPRSIFDYFKSWRLNLTALGAMAVLFIASVISINVFNSSNLAVVAFTAQDRADEELLNELDAAVTSDTAGSLDIYGVWNNDITEDSKGG